MNKNKKIPLLLTTSIFYVLQLYSSCQEYGSTRTAVVRSIVWRKAYFFHVRKWRKAYRRVGGDRWRTACVLWLAAAKIGGGDGDAEQTWVVICAMNRRNKNDAAE